MSGSSPYSEGGRLTWAKCNFRFRQPYSSHANFPGQREATAHWHPPESASETITHNQKIGFGGGGIGGNNNFIDKLDKSLSFGFQENLQKGPEQLIKKLKLYKRRVEARKNILPTFQCSYPTKRLWVNRQVFYFFESTQKLVAYHWSDLESHTTKKTFAKPKGKQNFFSWAQGLGGFMIFFLSKQRVKKYWINNWMHLAQFYLYFEKQIIS